MLRTVTAAGLLGLSLAGCWGPEGGHENVEPADASDAADALTRALRFERGEREPGELPTGIDGSVQLFVPGELLHFNPGVGASLTFDLIDPTDEFPEAILIWFDGSGEHLVVPTKGAATLGAQHIESTYALDVDVCDKLCADRLYALEMYLTVRFATDRIADPVSRPTELDCRGRGDAMYCPDDDSEWPPGAGSGGVGGTGS